MQESGEQGGCLEHSQTVTLEAEASPAVMKQAVKDYGKPEIINSDQGSRFTCEEWISYLESGKIEIGMDGKGRAIDNAFIDTNCIIRELTGRLRRSYTGRQHKKERKWTYQHPIIIIIKNYDRNSIKK